MKPAPSRVQLWDKDFNQLYDSDTDERTVEQYLHDQHVQVRAKGESDE